MQKKEWKASILLVLAAVIWGFAFVAQRMGIGHVGSFTFTGVRFALGAFSLLPLILMKGRSKNKDIYKDIGVVEDIDIDKDKAIVKVDKDIDKLESNNWNELKDEKIGKSSEINLTLKIGLLAGLILFVAASLQQIGLEDTTAGKAAFITGFYIILVPAFGVFLKQRTGMKTWIAAILAVAGLYLISVDENFTISRGDSLVFLCSFFFTAHILLINRYTRRLDTLKLSFVQYLTCSVLSMVAAMLFEEIQLSGILNAALPILYGGIFSVGIAYTLQVYGQRYAKASHAAIIMSLESVFAVIGGILILQESMNFRGYAGCLLMLVGVLISQYQKPGRQPSLDHVEEFQALNP